MDRHWRDAIFDEIVNKDLVYENFDSSMGIVMEQDINASSDFDHKEGLEYLVYFQKIDLMILQDPVRDIAQHFLISLYGKHRAGLDQEYYRPF